ncbi:uncharacterized protein LOC123295883 [Chrysoperla carnea]|uniref:uncharacterized protein LOC123295883 n=1 Tax=Chrysoperla carnea TaxID=189513 RepID=UPI001D062117|nr:uncharacterized protein LOC123295883 [Chrysoperla carnea]
MALFPAYENELEGKNKNEDKTKENVTWLENKSFDSTNVAKTLTSSIIPTTSTENKSTKLKENEEKTQKSPSISPTDTSIQKDNKNIFYELCLFLKQAGLYEYLYVLIKLYTTISLGQEMISFHGNEQELIEYETLILQSKLPTHELWLRIEKLRESFHFIPEDNSDDPQRIIFNDELNELIYPIIDQNNINKLIIIILNIYKIPLIPFRNEFNLNNLLNHNNIDVSIELLLPIFISTTNHLSIFNNLIIFKKYLLIYINGPQYINSIGNVQYLDFILNLFKYLINNNNNINLNIWFIRFQRLLLLLNHYKLINLTNKFIKQINKNIHEILKINNNNIYLYNEYALIKYNDANEFILNILKELQQLNDKYLHELLYESYVRLLFWYYDKFNKNIYQLFLHTLHNGIELYPNNYELLGILLSVETKNDGIVQPVWKLNKILTKSNECIPILVLLIIIEERFEYQETIEKKSIELFGGDCNQYINDQSKYYKLLSLYDKFTKQERIKYCALIWRLYLKFLYKHNKNELCKNIYYIACETCPWFKPLYMDAAVYIPTELPQIQDLITEKNLRIHITPEELQVLAT